MTRRTPRRRWPLATLLALTSSLLLLLVGAGSAAAANFANGDFEAGSLTGWQQQDQNKNGRWFAVSGTEGPLSAGGLMPSLAGEPQARVTPGEEEELEADEENIGKVLPPFQGNFDAVADENEQSSMVLYQEVAIDPLVSQQLSMYFNYHSFEPIQIPDEDSLELSERTILIPIGETEEEREEREEREDEKFGNQQVRVDLLKGGSSPTSLNPSDILATLYATKEGDARQIPWTHLSADVTPFGGQKVMLRIAVVDNLFYLNAGVDAVSITSPAPPVTPPSNVFTFGKLKKNAKNGTATLTVNVPGPGTLTLAGVSTGKGAKASVSATKAKKPGKPKNAVKPASATATAAGAVTLTVKPTAAAKKYLKAKGALSSKVAVTFTPTGGSANTVTTTVPLKLAKPKPKPKKK